MRTLIVFTVLFCFAAASFCAADNIDQLGSGASGRSVSGNLRLDSVLGQNVAGIAGALSSGFYSQYAIPDYLAGDVNGDRKINISDVVFLINYIFAGGTAPPSMAAADADCNGMVNISDAVRLLNYIFSGAAAPRYCR